MANFFGSVELCFVVFGGLLRGQDLKPITGPRFLALFETPPGPLQAEHEVLVVGLDVKRLPGVRAQDDPDPALDTRLRIAVCLWNHALDEPQALDVTRPGPWRKPFARLRRPEQAEAVT